MPAVFKQTWSIDPFVDLSALTEADVNDLFVMTRNYEVNHAINTRSADLINQNKTDHSKWKFKVDMGARVIMRCREFADLASAQATREWHETSHGTVFPASGQVHFSLIEYQVLDNTALDQVTL